MEMSKRKIQWRGLNKAIFLVILVIFFLRVLLISPTIVSGISMQPNFYAEDKVLVNKLVYTYRIPERGEVIVFQTESGRNYIKRVIALAGDTIMVKGDDVYINGAKVAEPYIEEQVENANEQGTQYNKFSNFLITTEGIVPATVPEDMLFVMGDNRSYSRDSRDRELGFIPIDSVIGRAELVYWPLEHFQIVEHSPPEVMTE